MGRITSIQMQIGQTIRQVAYENIKPVIGIKVEVNENETPEQVFVDNYPVLKRIWNRLFYNILFDAEKRSLAESTKDYALTIITKGETIPHFKPKGETDG